MLDGLLFRYCFFASMRFYNTPFNLLSMPNVNYKIFLSSEISQVPHRAPDAELTDVIVQLADGKEYTASFFSYSNMKQTIDRYEENGKNLQGKYFWFQNMFLIDDCSRANIELVVQDLLRKGDFWRVFGAV